MQRTCEYMTECKMYTVTQPCARPHVQKPISHKHVSRGFYLLTLSSLLVLIGHKINNYSAVPCM